MITSYKVRVHKRIGEHGRDYGISNPNTKKDSGYYVACRVAKNSNLFNLYEGWGANTKLVLSNATFTSCKNYAKQI